MEQSFCNDFLILIYSFLILKYGCTIRFLNLFIQIHHACGLKYTCQKFMVHISKLIMYRHVTSCPHKVKDFVANSAKF